MTVLVTGGAGYIGSHTVRALRSLDRDVVVLDSLELGAPTPCWTHRSSSATSRTDDLVTSTCREYGVTQVVHFAAYKSVGESMDRPAKYWRNNVGGTVELIEACLEAGVERRRVLVVVLGVRHARDGSRHRARADPSRERLRRDQGHGRADPRVGTARRRAFEP